MDIATLGIVIDPRTAKEGATAVKAELKSIEVSAKEAQAGVVASFEDTANKRKITIRDSSAATKQAEGEVTATVQAEASRRNEIDASTAAANRERLQQRLAASQAALEQMSMAEIEGARRASSEAIAAANATKESVLAAIEATRAGRLAEAREAMTAAQESAAAMKAAASEAAAAEKGLSGTQKDLLREHVGDVKGAVKETEAAQKAALAEIVEAEKAAAAAIKLQQKELADAEKAAARERIAAIKAVAAETKAAAKASADSETGWRKLERAAVQGLAMMGLVEPSANTALVGVQALQTGLEMTAMGFLGIAAAITGFLVVAAGIAGAVLLIKGLVDAAHLEPLENQLANAAGSFKDVEERMKVIRDIQHDSGGLWKIEGIVTANRELQLFTNGALAGEKSMRMIADAALVTGKPIEQVAAAVGKLYGAIEDKNPIDRYVKQLINLRLINQDVANSLTNMQKAGASPDAIWAKAEEALKGYSGAMDQYGRTAEGTLGRIKVDIDHVLEAFAKPLLPIIEPALRALEKELEALAPKAKDVGELVAGAIIGANWDDVASYIALRFRLGLNEGWTATVDTLKHLLLDLPRQFVAKLKEELLFVPAFLTAGVTPELLPVLAGAYMGTKAGGADNAELLAKIATLEAKFRANVDEAQAREWSSAGVVQGPQGTGEHVELTPKGHQSGVRDDATIMADFLAQLNELTYKMQQGTMSSAEFGRRREQLQGGTVKELGDPSRANDIYSNPAAADKVWQDILGKWRVFNEEKTRIAAAADEKIKAGEASMGESFRAGLNKISEQWGNLQQHISAGVGQIAQSIDNNLTGAITALITGTKDAKTAFRDMAVAILNDIVKICVQLLVELAIRSAIKALSGFATGGSVGTVGNPQSMDAQAMAVDGGQGGDITASPSLGGGSGGTIGGGSVSPVEPDLPSGAGSDLTGNGTVFDPNSSGFASGGDVRGGRGGIDDIPARLTRGEYVVPKDTADYYGTHFLDALRDRRVKVKGFAAGGPVGGPVRGTGLGGGSGDTYNINISVDAASGATKTTATAAGGDDKGGGDKDRMKALGVLISEGCRQEIVRQKRPGGLLNAT